MKQSYLFYSKLLAASAALSILIAISQPENVLAAIQFRRDRSYTAPLLESVDLAYVLQSRNDGGVILVDVRSKAAYLHGHIPGAKHFEFASDANHSNVPEQLTNGTKLILYCNGNECGAATAQGNLFLESGMTNLAIYRGGWPEWVSCGLPIEHSSTPSE